MPRARIKINNGTCFFTLGTETTICLCESTILTPHFLIGLEESSETERISALWLYKSPA